MADTDISAEPADIEIPAPPKPRNRGYWNAGRIFRGEAPPDVRIYVAECGDFIKVGIAKCIIKRWSAFACDNPYHTRLVAYRTIRADGAHLAERKAHERLAPYHHRNEWFQCDAETARKAINWAVSAVKSQPLPWDEYHEQEAERLERAWANSCAIEDDGTEKAA